MVKNLEKVDLMNLRKVGFSFIDTFYVVFVFHSKKRFSNHNTTWIVFSLKEK